MQEIVLLDITLLCRDLIKTIFFKFIYKFGSLLPSKIYEFKLSLILKKRWHMPLQETQCRRSAVRHYKMSLERRATCVAHPPPV